MKKRTRGKWTDETRQEAIALARAGASNDDIAPLVGMSTVSVAKLTWGIRVGGRRKMKLPKQSKRKSDQRPRCGNVAQSSARVPIHVSADRDLRIAARESREATENIHGVLTSSFFGDPPPGYSALDKKRSRGQRV